jgi:eukaryotic-like serine/threonine-protein kinase
MIHALIGLLLALTPSDVSVFRGDPRHTGAFASAVGPAFARLRWKFDAHGPVRGSLIARGGILFFGSGDGNLYAVDAGSGKERWRTALGGAVFSTPAISGDVVVATARERTIVALDRATGRVRWRFEAGPDAPFDFGWDYWLSSPTIAEDGRTVYAGSGDGRLYALDLASGRKVWEFETDGRVRSSPAVSDGVVYCGSMDGKVYALAAESGRLLWAFETEGVGIDQKAAGFDRRSIVSSPALSSDRLFVGSRDAHLYAVDRKSGRQAWRFGHPVDSMEGRPELSWVLSSPAVRDGLVFTGSSDGHFFNALRAGSGEEVWRFKTPSNVLSSGALAGGQVFFGCDDGHLFVLDAQSGAERWRFRAGDAVVSSPVVDAGRVYFGSDDGFVYALETGAEPAGVRPRRAVYWKDPAGRAWFSGNGAVKDYFVSEGYALLDDAGLARFLEARGDDAAESSMRGVDAAHSVVVVAIDSIPPALVAGPPESTPLRRYLAAGGRMVWLGLPIDVIERDAAGKAIRLDPARTGRLLGVDHTRGRADWMSARATAEGRRWGVPEWYIGGFAVPPRDVTTVLGLDEWGLASAWVRSFGGPPGSGFVRLWGRTEPIPDLSWVKAVAEHAD